MHKPKPDPPIPPHGGCASCGGPRPKPTRTLYGGTHKFQSGLDHSKRPNNHATRMANLDPFCSTECCRTYHEVPNDPIEPRYGRPPKVSRWKGKQERAHHNPVRTPRVSTRKCKECGVLTAERTPGCRTCNTRHAARAYNERRRTGSPLIAGTSGRRALAGQADEE